MKECKKPACTLLIAVIILSMGMTLVNVGAETLPKLFVDPKTYTATKLGEIFTININITNAHNLTGFEFKLSYNTTLLTALDAVEGPLPKPPINLIERRICDSEGYVWVAITCSRTEGNGTLAMITFNATYAWSASCALHLYDTELIDFYGDPIPHNVEDGNYEFVILGIIVATNKYSYLPGENVEIHGNLTLDGSPHQGLVGLEVDNPTGRTVVRTLQVGPTPPPENITIVEVYPCDSQGRPKQSFSIGEIAYFTVNVTNTGTASKNVTITFNAYDNNNVPFGVNIAGWYPLPGQTTQSAGRGVPIWDWVATGNATVYVSAFTDYPKDGGTPYCTEKSATFQIESSTLGAAALETQALDNNPTTGNTGNYSLTFKLPPKGVAPAGVYRVYATSSYKRQSVADTTLFGINVICVPFLPNSILRAYIKWMISITVTVRNEGQSRETFNVIAYYNSTEIGVKVVTLYPLVNKTLTFIWDTTGVSPGNYTLSVYAILIRGGTGTTNNTLADGKIYLRIWGDVNGDGKITLADIAKVKLVYSGIITDPELVMWSDINGDGKITLADIAKLKLIYSGIL